MAMNEKIIVNIAGYKFEPLDDPIDLISTYQQKCDELLLKGSMLISKNGICLLYTSDAADE